MLLAAHPPPLSPGPQLGLVRPLGEKGPMSFSSRKRGATLLAALPFQLIPLGHLSYADISQLAGPTPALIGLSLKGGRGQGMASTSHY